MTHNANSADVHADVFLDFALREWLDLSGTIGRADAMAARFDEIGGRPITGRAAQKLSMAREAVWVLTCCSIRSSAAKNG